MVETAQRKSQVLAVDWDLESPGLDQYFKPFADSAVRSSSTGGLIDLLVEYQNRSRLHALPDWRDFLTSIPLGVDHPLFLMTSGESSEDYFEKLSQLNWFEFFQEYNGGTFIESLRNEWKTEFDVTLIDSRTGLTDASGICTILLPDVIVAIFTASYQSLTGTRDVILRAQAARQQLPVDRMPLTVLPLLSRFDNRAEYTLAQQWIEMSSDILQQFYADWLPRSYPPREALERSKLPYVPYFSFGEQLPVITHGTSDPDSLGWAYEIIATLIEKDFKDAATILAARNQ